MKTLGEALKETRLKKRYSRERLEKETKIKKEFIKAIEDENWEVLPEFPVLTGFVKNIATVLKINLNQTVAFLRRDYPPKSLRINPKPDVANKFSWSPRLTFLAGIITVSLFILGYLVFQYLKFITPPNLTVINPKEEQVVNQLILEVTGKTNPEATIKVNNQPALVDEEGNFTTEIEIFEGTGEVVVKAISRSGKETTVSRKIKVELEGK